MKAEPSARARIVDVAARLFSRRGYASVGLNEIVEKSGAPKGSLYHYFPAGKEAIAAAAMQYGSRRFLDVLRAALDEEASVAAAVARVGATLAGWLAGSRFKDGCPITAVTVELAAYNETVRAACAEGYAAWRDLLAAALRGEGAAAAEADDLACWCVASIEGAVILARAHASTAPVESVTRLLVDRLARPLAASPSRAG